MNFSLFTTRTRQPSLRLRILARYFQGYSILKGATTIGMYVYINYFLDHSHTPRWAFTPPYVYIAVSSLSLFLVGRALLRRQRWGAALAGVILGAPIVKQLVSRYSVGPDIAELALGTLALCALVTVWDELGGVHDSDFDDEDDDDLRSRLALRRPNASARRIPALSSSPALPSLDIAPTDPAAATQPDYAAPRLLTTPAPTINNATARSPLPISTARDS